jgi:ABC-type phosphate transport system substrate-binding protein
MILNRLIYGIGAAALTFGLAHATTTTLNGGGSSAAAPTYIGQFELYTAANPSILFSYEGVGSGGGQKAFLNNDITQFENVPAGTITYGTIVGTQVDFGASDAPLTASQLTNPATGSYANSATDGPLIQFPTIGTPVAIAYNQSLQTSALKLTDAQVCGVFSGKITDWHSLNSKIKAGTTIEVAYRSDSSGVTYLLTQHLNKVCNSSNSSFPTLPVPVTKYFYSTTASNNPVYLTTPPSNLTGENGAPNIATYALATAGSLVYTSPDFTSIAPKSANTTSLKDASLVNATNGVAYQPSVANTTTGLTNPGAGSTDTTPPSTETTAADPLNWVPLIPVTNSGYPIVGYTTVEVSSCYADKTAGSALISFFNDAYGNSSYTAIVKDDGTAPLPSTFEKAVKAAFLSNSSGYNLNIDNATTCASYSGR